MATVRGLLVWNRSLQLRLLVGMPRNFRRALARSGPQLRTRELLPSLHPVRRRQSRAIPRQPPGSGKSAIQRHSSIAEGAEVLLWGWTWPDSQKTFGGTWPVRTFVRRSFDCMGWNGCSEFGELENGFVEGYQTHARTKTYGAQGRPGLAPVHSGIERSVSDNFLCPTETCPAQLLLYSGEVLGAHPP